jgi:hypothetical protein
MKTQKFILALLLIFTFTSCSNQNDSKQHSISKDQSVENKNRDITSNSRNDEIAPNTTNGKISPNQKNKSTPLNSTTNSNSELQGEVKLSSTVEYPSLKTEPMIIRKGTMNIEIENYPESEKEMFRIINNLNGYVSNSGSNVNTSGRKQGKIDIRIQGKDFDALINEISKTGKVMSLDINSSDVTDEFIDLEARVITQKALEERLINLLNERTAKLTDVVEVEEKLADVRSHIESMQGRMRFLKNQAEYSTLTISFFEPYFPQTTTSSGFFYELSGAFKEGLEGLTDVIAGLITFTVATSPLIILFLLTFYITRKFYLKWKIRKASVNIQTS